MGSLKTEHIWPSTSSQLLTSHARPQTGNRSPLESPPAAKKLLKTGGKLEFSATPSSPGMNRSILKPPRLAAVMSTANELGGASVGGARTRSWPGSLRRVNFEHNVDVVVYNPVDGDYVCSQSQQLNTEPRDRKQFIGRLLHGRSPKTATSSATSGTPRPQATHAQHPQSPAEPMSVHRPLPLNPSTRSGTTEHQQVYEPPLQQDLDFAFFEDHKGHLKIKFTVPLGPGVAAGDALVKANVAGNKIRVLGARTWTESGAILCRRQEFSWRYSLPMDVDPYAISARMDSVGNLFVEAPVITTDRRRTMDATDHVAGYQPNRAAVSGSHK